MNKAHGSINRTPFVLMAALLPASAGLFAQQNERPAHGNRSVIEEVMVTATKRERSVRELPISIDAFSGDELVEQGAVSLEKIIELSPGVTFQNRAEADSQTINIRGIGTSFAARFYNRPYGLFYEDVSLVNPTTLGVQPAIDPYDMATVEVLKGPQGTLFGGSGLIGAVRYVPKKPDFESLLVKLAGTHTEVSHSDDHSRVYSAVVNLPLIENRLAARYTITDRNEVGYIDDLNSGRDDVNEFDEETWRGQLAWNITSSLSLRGSYLERTVDQPDAATSSEEESYETDNKFLLEPSESLVEIGILDLSWTLNESMDLTVVASQLDKSMTQNRDGSGNLDTEASGLRGNVPIRAMSEQSSVEARLVGSTDGDCNFWLFCNTEYLVGAVQTESDQFVDVGVALFMPTEFGTAGEVTSSEISALAEEEAVFFDITRYFRNGLFVLNLGGRYFRQSTTGESRNKTRVESTFIDDGSPLGGMLATETLPPEYVDQEVEEFNPKMAITWNVADDLSFFASAVRGFRFGGINVDALQSDVIQPEFEPDFVWNYEIGMRSEWFDRMLLFDLTAYFVKWENAQQGLFDTSRVGAVAYIDNFGSTTVKGAEFSLRAHLPLGLTYSLSGAYTESRNNKAFQARNETADKGDLSPGSPLWTGNTSIGWIGQLGNFDLNANIGFTYQSVSKNSWEIPEDVDQIDNFNASFRVANTFWPGKPSVSLIALNLEDDINVSSFTEDRASSNQLKDEFFFLNSPRKISLRLELTFD